MSNLIESHSNSPDNQTPAHVAAVLADRFEILKPAGRTASERFYLARETDSGRMVNLRVLDEEAAADHRRLYLFRLEAYAAAMLSHKNILKSSAAEQAGDLHYSVIEHRSGAMTLREFLRRKGWLEPDQAASIALQIADALDHAHKAGVLHLRLSPEQVLVEAEGAVLVRGFGIQSKGDLEWAHRERSLGCPAQYLSPEQAMGAGLDHTSDFYSLGIILFEMLTDRVPFDSDDPEQIKRKHACQALVSPHLISAEMPRLMTLAIAGLLEKEPRRRFGKASDFQFALMRLLNSEPEAADEGGLSCKAAATAAKSSKIIAASHDLPVAQFETAAAGDDPGDDERGIEAVKEANPSAVEPQPALASVAAANATASAKPHHARLYRLRRPALFSVAFMLIAGLVMMIRAARFVALTPDVATAAIPATPHVEQRESRLRPFIVAHAALETMLEDDAPPPQPATQPKDAILKPRTGSSAAASRRRTLGRRASARRKALQRRANQRPRTVRRSRRVNTFPQHELEPYRHTQRKPWLRRAGNKATFR